jgi:glutathionyl-hydroquinone reductase
VTPHFETADWIRARAGPGRSLIPSWDTARSSAAALTASRAWSEPWGRRALVARSVTKTPAEAARVAVQARDWERNREAWNLPHATDAAVDRPADHDEPIAGESSAEPDRKPRVTPPPAE